MVERFTREVCEKLGHYVYTLIDPRNGKIFYIGKGQDNRVFYHARAEINSCDGVEGNELPLKLDVIKKIRVAKLEPIHVIHRHGMSREEALEVEAGLIDATPGLTNVVTGHGSNERGPAHVDELAEQYGTLEIEFDPRHKIVIIKIKQETIERHGSVYEAVRASWRINQKRAEQANYVLAVIDGICRGVFVADGGWEESKEVPGRYEFHGHEAEETVSKMYNKKRIPNRLRKPGMATPVLYEGY